MEKQDKAQRPEETVKYETKFYEREHYEVWQKINDILDKNKINPILTDEELWEIWDRLMDYLLDQARKDFYIFVKLVGPKHINGFKSARHIKITCKHLQQVEEGVALKDENVKNKKVHMPPGGSKSKMCSNLFPAWCLGRNPNWFILLVGHTIKFAEDNLGRATRDVMNYHEYQAIFPDVIIRKDVDAAGRFYTEQGGQVVATGVGSNIAGRRAHVAILDDVVSEQTSEQERADMITWYYDGLRSRLMPEGKLLLVMTRWFTSDIAGELYAKNPKVWDEVKFPAIVDQPTSEMLKLPVGASFWPELWPLKRWLAIRADMPSQRWSALYLQNPVPEEGTIFKKDNFQRWPHSDPPECDFIVASLDTAFGGKVGKNDPSAWQVWGVFERPTVDFSGKEIWVNHMILLDANVCWEDVGGLVNLCKDLKNDYSPDVFIVEKQASGNILGAELRKRGLPTLDFITKHDKLARAQASQVVFQNKRVWFPDADCADRLINEALEFPFGKHDDQVDAMTQAVLWLRDIYDMSRNVQLGDEGVFDDEDDEYLDKYKGKSYWNSVSFSVR